MAQCANCGKKIRLAAKHEGKDYCRDCYRTIKMEENEQKKIMKKKILGDDPC